MDQDTYLEKLAAHADERLKERTKARPEVLSALRKRLRAIKLSRGTHHVRIPGGGYAVLKDIGGRHVVATVLAHNMNPPGRDSTMRFSRKSLVKMAQRVSLNTSMSKPPAQTVTVKGLTPPPPPTAMGGVSTAPPVKQQGARMPGPAPDLAGMPTQSATSQTPTMPSIQAASTLKPQPGSNVDAVIKKASALARFRKSPQPPSDKPDWFPKAILAGALLGATHGALRPHSAFSGGIEQGKVGLKQRLAGGLVGSTVGAGIGWLPEIVYEGINGKD